MKASSAHTGIFVMISICCQRWNVLARILIYTLPGGRTRAFKNRRYKMKKMIKKMNMVLAGVLSLAVLGVNGANAGTAEYKNIIDLDRFVANLEDVATANSCSREEKVYTAVKATPEADYKNIINLDGFVAALKDPRDAEYRNIFTLETFVTALGGSTAPEYRNVIDLSRFVAALTDPKEVEYRNIIDLGRFVTALKDEKVAGSTEIACNDTANNYALAAHEVKSGI